MTRAEIIAIQTELGVKADGIWGPITAAAYAARMAHEAPGAGAMAGLWLWSVTP